MRLRVKTLEVLETLQVSENLKGLSHSFVSTQNRGALIDNPSDEA